MAGPGPGRVAHPLAPLVLRERVVLVAAVALAVGMAWGYLVWMAAGMAGWGGGAALAHHAAMPQAAMPGMPGMTSSRAAYASWTIGMWAVMAVAMMLPTALPLVLMFARFRRARQQASEVGGATAGLVLGYLAVWIAFGVLAATVQLGLERSALVTPMFGKVRSATVGGLVLVGAGLFQWSPLKTACLARCRSPLMFLMTRWRSGRYGPFVMGMDHGLFCLGCCWALMLVMFVVGVMNLLWMAALTVLMTLEKVLRRGAGLARVAGAALVVAGLALLLVRP